MVSPPSGQLRQVHGKACVTAGLGAPTSPSHKHYLTGQKPPPRDHHRRPPSLTRCACEWPETRMSVRVSHGVSRTRVPVLGLSLPRASPCRFTVPGPQFPYLSTHSEGSCGVTREASPQTPGASGVLAKGKESRVCQQKPSPLRNS